MDTREIYYSVRVKACYVVCVHPAYAPDGFVDEVQDLEEMVAVLMTQQRDRLHTSAAGAEPEPTQAFLVRHASAVETSQVQLADIHETVKRRRLTEAAQKTAKAFSDLFDATRAAGEDLISRMPAAQPGSGPPTIVQHATSVQNFVRAEQPTWEEAMVRLAAAALSVYRSRLSDMFIHDHVSLLWIMEGEIHLRAHAGICYMYHEHGAFEAQTGTSPESTFARVKNFLLALEGILRMLPANAERSDRGVTIALASVRLLYNTDAELVHS